MTKQMVELEFVSVHASETHRNYYHVSERFEAMTFCAIYNHDVIASFLVNTNEVEWSLVHPMNYLPAFPTPFFLMAFFEKCPNDLIVTVIIGFCKFFFKQHPEYETIYTQVQNPNMKEVLLYFGFKEFTHDTVYYQKEEGSE